MDEENEITEFYEILPDMIWAVRLSPDEVKLYINETDTLTFSQAAIDAIMEALAPFA